MIVIILKENWNILEMFEKDNLEEGDFVLVKLMWVETKHHSIYLLMRSKKS